MSANPMVTIKTFWLKDVGFSDDVDDSPRDEAPWKRIKAPRTKRKHDDAIGMSVPMDRYSTRNNSIL
jgi:hypothetical protein